jgi:aspartyl-tRNA(Asn)/glutamyl-tRNA(Gln) amidotransferase subunit B
MPSVIAKQMQATKIDDAGELSRVIDTVFRSDPGAVEDARKNPSAVNFIFGLVMKATNGRADPKAALELIRKKLNGQA